MRHVAAAAAGDADFCERLRATLENDDTQIGVRLRRSDRAEKARGASADYKNVDVFHGYSVILEQPGIFPWERAAPAVPLKTITSIVLLRSWGSALPGADASGLTLAQIAVAAQVSVQSAEREQLRVDSAFHDAAVVEHQNLIGVAHR